MRTGCIVAAVVLVIVIGIAGYYAYQMIDENLDLPADLEAYTSQDSMMMQIHSQAPAPADTAHLTRERLEIFTGALDSLGAGWRGMARLLDSLQNDKDGGKEFSLWSSPAVISEAVRAPFRTRRALVAYLNARNISWAEYLWLKERTVAASGITHQQSDSALNAVLYAYFDTDTPDLSSTNGEGTTTLFKRIEEIRGSGSIDSAEIALVAPLRGVLLSKGLPALMNMEVPGSENAPKIHVNTKMKSDTN